VITALDALILPPTLRSFPIKADPRVEKRPPTLSADAEISPKTVNTPLTVRSFLTLRPPFTVAENPGWDAKGSPTTSVLTVPSCEHSIVSATIVVAFTKGVLT
jgi:hypothetical protein